ncbi:thioredoxin domain-containing protein 12 [Harpegnathos saltator]|uniref:Thioredoxin domain-containing protein 12 n=1 Tax=Harpegnathos saltator TaxID=610380 RepID=E2BND8_HARSA|nr:thioredoxin domain-containing protein 12 [Harpegnathos saltator]EFN82717.1 Thioredoxin domain-containing protein 12 [Harpegnathos saltator]
MRYARCLGSWKLGALACYLFGNVIAIDDRQGFGHMFKWRNLEEAFDEARIVRKPIFLLIYKSGCPTCEKLKPKFRNSLRIHDLSQHFVMVNARKGEMSAKDEARFQPDGTYVPRILFFTSDGEFMEDVYNRHPKADNKCKYFYSNTTQIIDSMLLALERCPKES